MSAQMSEAAVIGACLVDETAYWEVANVIQQRDFSHRGYAAIFGEVAKRAGAGEPIDMFVIADERPELREVIFGEPVQQQWRRGNVRAYAEVVQRAAVARRVRLAGQQIAHLEGDDILGEAQHLLGACEAHVAGGMRHIRDHARDAFRVMEGRLEATGEMSGLPTGIPDLDKITGGLQPSDLVLIAANSGVGKTAFALQIARATAKHLKAESKGRHVGIFSLEMAGAQLSDRLVSAEGRFNGKLLRTPKLMEETDWPRWNLGMTIVSDLPILVDDHADVTVETLCAVIRQQHAMTPFGLVVLDYIQLLQMPKADRADLSLGIISRALKVLAKELNITVLTLSQLNRDFTDRPRLKNLRGSAALGHDADVVMFLHLPDESVLDYVELLLDKHRNGEKADLALEFQGEYQTFRMATARPPSVKSRARTADQLWDEIDGGAFA